MEGRTSYQRGVWAITGRELVKLRTRDVWRKWFCSLNVRLPGLEESPFGSRNKLSRRVPNRLEATSQFKSEFTDLSDSQLTLWVNLLGV